MKTTFARAIAALTCLVAGGCALQRATPIWTADIHAAAQRFWNRQVVVEGQVSRVEADPVGTTRGRYLLIDDSDPDGIIVVSRELPAPGAVFRVQGQVVQDPRNAVRPMLRELERVAPPGDLLRLAIIGSAALAVLMIGLLAWMLTRPEREPAGAGLAPARTADETQAYSPPPVREDLTRAFDFWGVELAVVEGPDAGKAFPIGSSPLHIGRVGNTGRRNDIQLSDPTVSREQATLTRNKASGAFSLTHDGQRNPTIVNGREIDSTELEPGAKIRFGATVAEFRRAE